MDTYIAGAILVSGSTTAGVLGLLAVRKVFDARTLVSCHDVGGYLLSVVGTLYAVLLGLVVVDSMGKFQEARQTIEQEANSLADLVLFARHLPERARQQIQQLAITYADLVIEEEWPAMDRGEHAPEARASAIALFDAVCAFEPSTESEKAIYAAQIEAATQLWNSRRSRTIASGHDVPALEWFVLILGGAMTVAFTYFFMVENLKIQVVMTALVTTSISLNVYLVLMFGYPFSGDLRIDPSPFRVARALIEHGPSAPPARP